MYLNVIVDDKDVWARLVDLSGDKEATWYPDPAHAARGSVRFADPHALGVAMVVVVGQLDRNPFRPRPIGPVQFHPPQPAPAPFPTQEAYGAVCAALWHHRARIRKLYGALDAVKRATSPGTNSYEIADQALRAAERTDTVPGDSQPADIPAAVLRLHDKIKRAEPDSALDQPAMLSLYESEWYQVEHWLDALLRDTPTVTKVGT